MSLSLLPPGQIQPHNRATIHFHFRGFSRSLLPASRGNFRTALLTAASILFPHFEAHVPRSGTLKNQIECKLRPDFRNIFAAKCLQEKHNLWL
jgi:hypothetical protein